jgi:hypothetical protein
MLEIGGNTIELAIVITTINAQSGLVNIPSAVCIDTNHGYASRKQQSKGFHAHKNFDQIHRKSFVFQGWLR